MEHVSHPWLLQGWNMGSITTRQLALICRWCFLASLCVSLFMCLLVYRLCPLLLISSALILCFIAAGVQNVHVAAAALCTHILPSPSSKAGPTMLMRSKLRCVTIISTLYHFILPPLHPSQHVHLCFITPVIVIPLFLPCSVSPFFPFASLPPSVSHYLLLLSLLSSESYTSCVLTNFPCP